jgi:asparagine synthase (glutamine-hydrolysing)
MCGITGLIDFRKTSTEAELKKMTTAISHRGPDGEGLELIQSEQALIGFGHRRLAILDLTEHGKQPMQFEHLWLCYE